MALEMDEPQEQRTKQTAATSQRVGHVWSVAYGKAKVRMWLAQCRSCAPWIQSTRLMTREHAERWLSEHVASEHPALARRLSVELGVPSAAEFGSLVFKMMHPTLPADLASLPGSALKVLIAMRVCQQEAGQPEFPASLERLTTLTSMARQTVFVARQTLLQRGLIQPGSVSGYYKFVAAGEQEGGADAPPTSPRKSPGRAQ